MLCTWDLVIKKAPSRTWIAQQKWWLTIDITRDLASESTPIRQQCGDALIERTAVDRIKNVNCMIYDYEDGATKRHYLCGFQLKFLCQDKLVPCQGMKIFEFAG
ncbi:hypothetical protein V6N13_088399 [Hibiscus sabdariffa]|uniref:Uncharacterized protein n=1 Tax=Hibiscus sabdariffa TaxID=183260 RepID=A0ABR2FZG2_9ROSI